jgi:hypothetical protein
VAPVALTGDDAALSALEVMLPPDAHSFVATLRAEVAAGQKLRDALGRHRRLTDPALMAACDGWRVLSRAAPMMLMGRASSAPDKTLRMFRLNAPRKW